MFAIYLLILNSHTRVNFESHDNQLETLYCIDHLPFSAINLFLTLAFWSDLFRPGIPIELIKKV